MPLLIWLEIMVLAFDCAIFVEDFEGAANVLNTIGACGLKKGATSQHISLTLNREFIMAWREIIYQARENWLERPYRDDPEVGTGAVRRFGYLFV